MFGSLGQAGMRRALKQLTPSENPMVASLADIIAGIEYEQAAAIEKAVDAADLDIAVHHDREQRRDELLAVADAVADQEFRAYWFREVIEVESPEQVAQYVGYDGDQWRDQLETWYQQYRELGLVDEPLADADRAELGHIAAMHVQESFGMTLDEFVAGVLNWDRGAALETVVAGPVRSYTRTIDRLAGEIEQRNDRIEELENRVAELESET